METSLADRTSRKIAFHILPLIFILYMIAYLDRAPEMGYMFMTSKVVSRPSIELVPTVIVYLPGSTTKRISRL